MTWNDEYWKFIMKHKDRQWNWCKLSRNENITMDIVRDNPDKPWDWDGLSCNKNITINIIRDNPDKPWDWSGLSCNSFNSDKELFYKRKFVQENLLEEFVKCYMRPSRIIMILETMDINPDQLDEYL